MVHGKIRSFCGGGMREKYEYPERLEPVLYKGEEGLSKSWRDGSVRKQEIRRRCQDPPAIPHQRQTFGIDG